MVRLTGLCAVIGVAALLSACSAGPSGTEQSGAGEASSAPAKFVTITADDLPALAAGPPITDPTAPRRIVSVAMGVADTLVALGAADRVVGRDETSSVDALAGAPVVTRGHELSAERVLNLDPDLVIADARTSPPEALDRIRDAGVRVELVPEAWSLADIAPRVQAIAAAVGADPSAVAAPLPPPTLAPDGPRVAFLYLRGTSAIYLVGGRGSGADSLIEAAGGVDVGAANHDQPFIPLTAEAMAALNPDVLLVMTKGLQSVNGVDGLGELPGVAQTRAGRERRIIAVDDSILLTFGPRTPAVIDLLREALQQVAP